MRGLALEPPFENDEAERIKEIVSNLDSLLLPAYDKIILGQMSLEGYDAEVEAIGMDALLTVHFLLPT